MKTPFLLACFIFFSCQHLYAGDTLHVVSHNKETIVTDPATGGKSYKRWVVFPSAKTAIRKVNLNVIFGCPDSMRCADWDYLDHIYIRRQGGINGPSADYEIGHMLTPYGGAFPKTWGFEWQVDITDFRPLLKDSVEIEYFHSGYEPNNDRGWKITVDFELIKGKPVLEPVAIHKIYDSSFRYGDSTYSIEAGLKPATITTAAQTRQVRIFIYQTGHGMDADGCGEFCSRYREVWFDGKLVDKRDIWKKCGDNPLYPQAGTWVIDRAYWCPGELQQPDIFDVPVKGSTAYTFDINMEPYVAKKQATANEVICAYIVEYKRPSAANDIAVEDIIVPTNKQVHGRKNPSAVHPTIVIRNNGSAPLLSAKIRYGTQGFATKTLNWKGKLLFNQQAIIGLPSSIDATTGSNNFEVNVSSPNGKKDGYTADNSMQAAFTKAPVHGTTLVLNLRTNNQPQQNAYTLKDETGRVVYEKKHGELKATTDYRDTFKLSPGQYELALVDTAGDGLEFWFNTRGGRGVCRLLDDKGQLLRHFDSDFGNTIYYSFEVSDKQEEWTAPVAIPAVGLFPTRTAGKTTLDYFSNTAQKVTVQIVTDTGDEIVEEHVYNSLKEAVLQYDMSYRPAQRYYVKVFIAGELVYNKRLRVEEMRRRQ